MNDLVARARLFATEAHERTDQRRKYTDQTYQGYLRSVAAMAAEVTDDLELVAAAWLHDTSART